VGEGSSHNPLVFAGGDSAVGFDVCSGGVDSGAPGIFVDPMEALRYE